MNDSLMCYLQDVVDTGTPNEQIVARTCMKLVAAPQQQAEPTWTAEQVAEIKAEAKELTDWLGITQQAEPMA